MFQKYFRILVCIALVGCGLVQSCEVNVRSPYPLFSKKFGSRNITFRAKDSGVSVNENEAIEVYCGTGIKYQSNYYGSSTSDSQQTARISCSRDNNIFVTGRHETYGSTLTVYCASSSGTSLYESQNRLPNCDDYMNYVIGEETPFMGTITKSAICYDLESFALKYVNYIAYEKTNVWTSQGSTSNQLDMVLAQKVGNLDNYFEFMSQTYFNNSRDRMRSGDNTFFKDFEFDFDSILQDEQDDIEKKNFAYIFNIMWWRLLRQNNWRFFLDALKQHTKFGKYSVYIGSYGNATMPVRENAGDLWNDLSVDSSNAVVTAPTYIWAYLKSLTPGNDEEFVVVAHNSPYMIAPDHTQFCSNDICDDIKWLKDSKFGQLRRIPTFGYTFCCRADEVAKIIDYFPIEKKAMETTTGSPIELTTVNNIKRHKFVKTDLSKAFSS